MSLAFPVKQKKIVLLFIVVAVGTLGLSETDGGIILSQNAVLCFSPIKKIVLVFGQLHFQMF